MVVILRVVTPSKEGGILCCLTGRHSPHLPTARGLNVTGPDDLRAAPFGRGCTQCRTHEKSADDGEVEERAGGGRWWWWSRFRPGHERLQLARRDLRHLRCVREAVDADFASRELAETVHATLRQDLLHRPFSALGACAAEHLNRNFGMLCQLFGHLGLR